MEQVPFTEHTTTSVPNHQLAEPIGSITPHLLIWLVQLVALLSPEFLYRRLVFTSAIVVCAIWVNIWPHFTNNPDDMQPFSLAWAFYLSTLEKILLSGPRGPEASFWRRGRPQEALGYAAFGLRKLKWSLMLIFSVRGVGWNWQVKNTPSPRFKSRWAFVSTHSMYFIYHMLLADLLITLGIRMWYSSPEGMVGEVNSKYLTLRDPDWRWQFVRCLTWACLPYHAIQMQYIVCALLAVALGLSSPEDWPPFFGDIKDVTTVRTFWGKFWHQTIRRMINGLTGAAVDFAGIRRSTNLSSYTQLWLGFGVSGVMHALSMRMFPSPTNISLAEKTIGMLQFFTWQAVAISLEDFVLWNWREFGGKAEGMRLFRSATGYLWVTLSFWYSIPFAADVMLRVRAIETSPLPFEIFGPLLLPSARTP